MELLKKISKTSNSRMFRFLRCTSARPMPIKGVYHPNRMRYFPTNNFNNFDGKYTIGEILK
ncbi:MAG: hypothetical protein ACFFD5_16370 [Candidatus Thorarchaeota archaeon]